MSEPLRDHADASDAAAAPRYFATLRHVPPSLRRVAVTLLRQGWLTRPELRVIGGHLDRLSRSFEALSLKYAMAGRDEGAQLSIDRQESGFPLAMELFHLANDGQQAAAQLASLPPETELRERMLREILEERRKPKALQYALSQRLYHQRLVGEDLYLPRRDPQAHWLSEAEGRRRWLLSWAGYDTEINLPVIYLLEVEDGGRIPLPKDHTRWPLLQAHLMAQTLNWLKLPTILQGFEAEFEDLHPKGMKRLHLGPLYAPAFTRQSGPLAQALCGTEKGQNWAMVWTLERLPAAGAPREATGWFSFAERQFFTLDPFLGRGAEGGATLTERFVLLPEAAHQRLVDSPPPGLEAVARFILDPSGRAKWLR